MLNTTISKRSFYIDRISAMRRQETNNYYCSTFEQRFSQSQIGIDDFNRMNSHCREKICSWSYEIIDYFELSRRTVALSLDLFDRYFAKSGINMYDERSVRLVSLTSLYIAIKVHETKKVEIYTLMRLCIGYFLFEDIQLMELEILKSLKWMVNPPTTVDFIYHFLKLLPVTVRTPIRNKIFEVSCYVAELSVCDSFFVGIPRSNIAFAAILNVLDHEICPIHCPVGYQEEFLSDLCLCLNLNRRGNEVNFVRKRLQDILNQ